jgi:hypothetical protein
VLLVEGQAHRHRHVARERPHRRDGRLRLVERRHRLQQEEVDASLEQPLGLLPVGLLRLLEPDVPDRGQGLADRADRAGHEGATPGRLARDPRPLAVDLPNLCLQAVGPQLEAVGTERVRLDDVGPRLDVLVVDLPHEAGTREVELVEAPVQEDAAGVEHGAHGPVEDDGPFGQAVEKRPDDGGRGLFAHFPQSTAARAFAPRAGRRIPLVEP